jgi:hypothetical protein
MVRLAGGVRPNTCLSAHVESPEIVDLIMYGEDRWVTACQHEKTRAVVLVHVTDLGLPSAESSPYLEGSCVRERANRA